jgi:hypothetical protein
MPKERHDIARIASIFVLVAIVAGSGLDITPLVSVDAVAETVELNVVSSNIR